MVSSARDLPETFELPGKSAPSSPGRNFLWRARLGSVTYSSPVVSDGKVFIGTNDASPRDIRHRRTGGGLLMCFQADSGKLAWELPIPRYKTIPGFDHMNLGLCSTPTVQGKRLYVVSSRCEVLCVDTAGMSDGNDGPFTDEAAYFGGDGVPIEPAATDGDIIWRFDMVSEAGALPHDCAGSSVLIDGDVLYVCTSNGIDGYGARPAHPDAPSLIALDKNTGRLLAVDNEKVGRRLFHGQWSSPSMGYVGGKKQIYFGAGDGVCYAFEPYDPASPQPTTCPATGPASRPTATASSRPAAEGERPTCAILKKIWSFDCNPPEHKFLDGKPRKYPTRDGPSEIIATPVPYDGRVYVAVGQDTRHGKGVGVLTCIDASGSGDITSTGKVWSCEKVIRSTSTVSIADGLLYIMDFSGQVHCLDALTGKLVWSFPTGRQLLMGSTLVADGKVYFGTDNGGFYCLAAGRELKVLGKSNAPGAIATTPAAMDGVIYLATTSYLLAIGRSGASAESGAAGGATTQPSIQPDELPEVTSRPALEVSDQDQ